MSDLIRRQVVRTGYFPEEFVLYAFGGAGPVHAAGFAAELGVGKIYVFAGSPVFSAFGVAAADVIHTRVVNCQYRLPAEPDVLNERLSAIEEELKAAMVAEGFRREDMSFRRFFTMRYRRQTAGVEIPILWDRFSDLEVTELQQMFEKKYEELYGAGAGYTKAGIEISAIRVDAVGPVQKPALKPQGAKGSDAGAAIKGRRQVFFTRRLRPARARKRRPRPGHHRASIHHDPRDPGGTGHGGRVPEPRHGGAVSCPAPGCSCLRERDRCIL